MRYRKQAAREIGILLAACAAAARALAPRRPSILA
jgi:hypothetical protein